MSRGSQGPCNHRNAVVINTRPFSKYRYRRYKCRTCGKRWSTVEIPVEVKRGGRQELMASLEHRIGLSEQQQHAVSALITAFIGEE